MANEHGVIHLSIYGDTAFRILQIIENTHKNYYGFSSQTTGNDRAIFKDISVGREADGEIVLETKCPTVDGKTKTWLATLVKGFAKMSTKVHYWQRYNVHKEAISKCEGWCRTNDGILKLFDDAVRMSDMYALYEVLKGRKVNWSKFASSDVKDRIAGRPFDPVRTECELSYREQLADINAKFRAEAEVENKRYDSEYGVIYEKHNEKIKAIKKANLDAIAKLDAEYAEIRNANAGLSEQPAVQVA